MDTIPKEKGGVRSCTGDFCFFLVHRCLLRAKNQVTPSAHESGRDEGVDDSRGAGARVVPGDEVLEAHHHVSVVVSPGCCPPCFVSLLLTVPLAKSFAKKGGSVTMSTPSTTPRPPAGTT